MTYDGIVIGGGPAGMFAAITAAQNGQKALESVRYAADRADDTVKFTDEALMTILGVPRVFLSVVLKGCVSWAKENNVTLITAEHMQIINDKRSKEKNKK